MAATNEKVHDGKMLTKLINQFLGGSSTTIMTSRNTKSNNKVIIKMKSALADGTNDFNTNIQFLQENGITSGMKLRKNSIVSPKKTD